MSTLCCLFQSPSPVIRSTSVDTLSVDTLEDDGDEVDGNVVIYIHVKCRNLEQGKLHNTNYLFIF